MREEVTPAGRRPEPLTYRSAGVDLEAAEETISAIRPHVERTTRPEVLGGIGGFGGLFALDPTRWRAPVMVTATDGVGTKLELARRMARHRGVGRDLVAMVVDDIVVTGAEPLVLLDYVAVGALDPAHVEQVVAGIADGCVDAGCALVGGEIAEHPGMIAGGGYDLAGFGVGIVERTDLLGPHRVRPGDAVVAMASSGPHANGYSLIRRIIEGLDLERAHGLSGGSLGEALLTPTRIYARDCLALAEAIDVHALCHITGGGIPGNLPRSLPVGLGATVDVDRIAVPQVLSVLQRLGDVDVQEMWRVFNMGAGMLAIVAAADAEAAVGLLAERGVDAVVCGRVVEEPGVQLHGLG